MSWREFCEDQDWDALAFMSRERDAGKFPDFTQGREDVFPVTIHTRAPAEGIPYPRAVRYTEEK